VWKNLRTLESCSPRDAPPEGGPSGRRNSLIATNNGRPGTGWQKLSPPGWRGNCPAFLYITRRGEGMGGSDPGRRPISASLGTRRDPHREGPPGPSARGRAPTKGAVGFQSGRPIIPERRGRGKPGPAFRSGGKTGRRKADQIRVRDFGALPRCPGGIISVRKNRGPRRGLVDRPEYSATVPRGRDPGGAL